MTKLYSLFLWYRYWIAYVLIVVIGVTKIADEYLDDGPVWAMLLQGAVMLALLYAWNYRGRFEYGFIMLYALGTFSIPLLMAVLFRNTTFDVEFTTLVASVSSVFLFFISLVYFRKYIVFTFDEDELVSRFVDLSVNIGVKPKKKRDLLRGLYAAMRHKDSGLKRLVRLLEHENDNVKITTAYFLLTTYEQAALHTLDTVGKGEGNIAAVARRYASMWRSEERDGLVQYLT